ncbi:ABC transporter ATP-binding protein [Paenibacillus azoreducens]|uniref:HMP/thiamine import ATP-binding protein YkoD n=1 Tax=Paenibacillus azoreducens TaxID=116718 RepID=A0A919YIJ6_9BACL|nr:ATP-binding cassette domain-containing protein [Paenibacillus azoreducens]GIO49925.1 putative HMP/thiamine import ATP-binding protein YkoD [Paenibacillus azoreducens]
MPRLSIKCTNLTYYYDDERGPALQGLDLSIPEGEWTAVIGPGGSGKSTLCQLLSGYLPRSGGGKREGGLELGGIDPATAEIAEIAERCGLVFQDPDAQLVQGTPQDEAAFGPENLRVPPPEIERRVEEALAAVNLEQRRHSPVRELSGGQRQRTAIAAVLALRPRIVVFDDASASLDPAAQGQFVQLCRKLHAEGRTLITASGRFDDAARSAERVIVLAGGRVLLDGPPQELLRKGRGLLAQLGLLPPWEGAAKAGPGLAAGPAVPAASAHMTPPGAAADSGSLLAVDRLSFAYAGAPLALHETSFAMKPGEWGIITGENGSGKTTLTRLLMGLLPVPIGAVFWQGQDMAGWRVRQRAAKIGYVFQQPEHQFVAHTVWDELIYGLGRKKGRGRELDSSERERAESLLLMAGLEGRRGASPYLLSQGEKKLLSIIAQFVHPKSLYILDEPTSGIDYGAADKILRLCREQAACGAAVLMITHDPALVEGEASFMLKLYRHKPAEYRRLASV